MANKERGEEAQKQTPEQTPKQAPKQAPREGDEQAPERIGLFEAIAGRRTIRKFLPQPVEWEKLMEVVSAGMCAPSSGNLQNWSFIIVTDQEKIRKLYDHTLEQEVFMTTPIAVIVCGDNDIAEKYYGLRGKRLYTIQNCAACIQNMLLAAHGLGLGTCWVGAFDEEKIDFMFEIPGDIRAQAIILLGYPDEEPEPKERKQIEHLISFNKYGESVRRPHLVLRDYSEEWAARAEALRDRLTQQRKRLPSSDELKKKSQEFFSSARERLDKAVGNLKDEEKAARRQKRK